MLSLLLACSTEAPPPEAGPRFRQERVWLVWMPYDNDLAAAAEPVLEGLRKGTEGGDVEVAVQWDVPGQPGMNRTTLAEGRGQDGAIEAEDSADIGAFRDFLDWAEIRYEARQYGILLLDHGGGLDQVCRDGERWLSAEAVARAIADFRERERGEVELVFLQVCGKATLETAWSFRDAGRALLASQQALGAPNSWYPQIGRLRGSGPEWAAGIAEAEGTTMYVSYTCFELSEARHIPKELALRPGPLPTERAWVYGGDAWLDLADLATPGFQSWVERSLSCGHWESADPPEELTDGFPEGLSGVSVFLPPPQGLPPGYGQLGIYRESGLDEALLGASAQQRGVATPSGM